MFIGGCPGSTAGGIKVTTLVVLFAAVKSTLCGEDTTTFLRHRFDPGMVYKSLTVVAFALVVSVLNVSLILALHHGVSILDAMIEAVSAFATVGLSASLTPTLHPLAKLALTLFPCETGGKYGILFCTYFVCCLGFLNAFQCGNLRF